MKRIVPVYGVISHLSFVICYFGSMASVSSLVYLVSEVVHGDE